MQQSGANDQLTNIDRCKVDSRGKKTRKAPSARESENRVLPGDVATRSSLSLFKNFCAAKATRIEFPGGDSGGATPVPFSNTAVKSSNADGTVLETGWESRSPPGFIFQEGPAVLNYCKSPKARAITRAFSFPSAFRS